MKNPIREATFVRSNWWLRDVNSSANFANVNNNGNANNNNASNSNGVRPDFAPPDKTFEREARWIAKGKVVSGAILNDSAEMRGCAVSVCLMR